ncbi:hypothetical protein J6TS1_18650 [Siminovitchia terrae]|uniref:N-acetyltransferase domain-containing protein n=1 Tax=Siminovitchia terrae TaxID=1914933 RepID=A0ABQ4KVD4_SIMTE|nr:GNAT family N-acetyltransferase [Siminovitchia terrae]GIN95995.1 hypothetical protein J6TS1_18650 [Siminovitchia terrae]
MFYVSSSSENLRLGKEYWGKGIATNALREFLKHVTIRPLYARAAKDNAGSLKVLKKFKDKVFVTLTGAFGEQSY